MAVPRPPSFLQEGSDETHFLQREGVDDGDMLQGSVDPFASGRSVHRGLDPPELVQTGTVGDSDLAEACRAPVLAAASDATALLKTILKNIVDNPGDKKFRRLNVTGRENIRAMWNTEACRRIMELVGFGPYQKKPETHIELQDNPAQDDKARQALELLESQPPPPPPPAPPAPYPISPAQHLAREFRLAVHRHPEGAALMQRTIRLLSNRAEDRENHLFRQVRRNNEIIQKILAFDGAEEFLVASGFQCQKSGSDGTGGSNGDSTGGEDLLVLPDEAIDKALTTARFLQTLEETSGSL